MKRTLSVLLPLLLILPLCLLLSACGGGETETTAATEAPQTTAATTESPQTTAAPATTGAATTNAAATTAVSTDAPATTKAPQTTAAATTNAPQTASAPATTDDGLYTIVFSVDGKETAIEVPKGETPVLPASVASSWETEENYCRILGWDKEFAPADADTTYTATVGKYGLTLYDVRFVFQNEETVTVRVREGEIPTPPDGSDAPYFKNASLVGTFKGWDPSLTAFTAADAASGETVTYTAKYTYEVRTYSVVFRVGNREFTVASPYLSIPECPVDPAQIAEEGLMGRFVGWDKEIAKVKADATYTAVIESFASVAAAKNGAKAILTMTYDRNTTKPSQSAWVLEMHEKYGIRGTNMLIVGRLNDSMAQGWKDNFAQGSLDVGSLGMKHESSRIETTHAIYVNEIVESKYLLQRLFPEQDVICFASPYAQLRDFSYAENPDGTPDKSQKIYDGGSKKIARDAYFAVRNGENGLNSLDPGCTDEAGGWYNLKVQWFYNSDRGQTEEERAGWIDNAVEQGGWLLILGHDFLGSDDYLSLTQAEGEAFYKHAAPYIRRGELWAATFTEATKYLREKQGTTVAERLENDVVCLDMTINRETEDGKIMEESVFNYPLTVNVRVPSEWQTVYYTADGVMKTARTRIGEDGFNYVTVNLTPGADGAVVTTEFRKLR